MKDYFFISVGVILYSLSMTIFMLPYGLATGGVAGISSIVYYATGLEVQVTYVSINLLLLIAAIKVLGVKFCLKTIYAVFFMTFALWFVQRLFEEPSAADPSVMVLPRLIGDESFMACVLGAICCGVGLTFCFENNGSTGGTDIIAAIVNKYKAMSLGSVIRICDMVIIGSCYFIFHDWFRVIYGFVTLFVCSMTLDYCIRRRHQSVQFMIFSRNASAISNAIISTGHGVTVLDGEGWYTRSSRKVIISIIRRREQVMIQRMIKEIDPYAFVSLSDASEVWGEGFDQMKVESDKKADKNKRVLVYASNSSHKLAEARAIFGEHYEIRSLADIGCFIDIPEKAGSLQGNALLKARFVKRYYGFDCVADDTALECNVLGGLPGLHSRNYALADLTENEHNKMEELDDTVSQEMLNILHNHEPIVDKPKGYNVKANVSKLLDDMRDKGDRAAKLHTVVAFVTGDYENSATWRTQTFEGELSGTVANVLPDDVEGSFYYDSVFIPDGFNQTLHQLGVDTKNKISQRAVAINKLKAYLDTTK